MGDRAESLVGSVLEDRYRVLRKIGEGGMGDVYEVEHLRIRRRMAVKTLQADFGTRPELVQRFEREAFAAAAVGNEHIVEVTDSGTLPNGMPFLVFELLSGIELGDLLAQERRLPVRRAVRIAKQIATGLAAAHAKGVVHRDLKPGNVFLLNDRSTEDFVKIVDFGISKFVEASHDLSGKLTKTGTALGTPAYMAPEQVRGRDDLDGRVDIYALGVLLYEMLSGQLPFDSDHFPELMVKIINATPTALRELRPSVPESLARVVRVAMARERETRFDSMEELREALERIEGDLVDSRSAPPPDQAPSRTASGLPFARTQKSGAIESQRPPDAGLPDTGPLRAGQETVDEPLRPEAATRDLKPVTPDPAAARPRTHDEASAAPDEGGETTHEPNEASPALAAAPTLALSTTLPTPVAGEVPSIAPERQAARLRLWIGGAVVLLGLTGAAFLGWRTLGSSDSAPADSPTPDPLTHLDPQAAGAGASDAGSTPSTATDGMNPAAVDSSDASTGPAPPSAAPDAGPPVPASAPADDTGPRVRRPAPPRFAITVSNQRRAAVHLTFRCGRQTRQADAPAHGSVRVRLRGSECTLTCSGVGRPRCPPRVRAADGQITVR